MYEKVASASGGQGLVLDAKPEYMTKKVTPTGGQRKEGP